MRGRSVLLAIVVMCTFAPDAAFARPFIVGPWRGEPNFKDAKFTHCTMRARTGEWRLFVSKYPGGEVVVGVFNRRMNFTKRNRLSGSIQFDSGPAVTYGFFAVRKDTVGANSARVRCSDSRSRAACDSGSGILRPSSA